MRIWASLAATAFCAVSSATAVAADISQPVISEAHDRLPGSEIHEVRAQCGASIKVSWTSKAVGKRVSYDSFNVDVGGKPALSEEQRRDAVSAMNRLNDRHDLTFVGGRVRCDSSRSAGTVRIISDPSKRGSTEGYLFLILDDRHGGLMFKPSSGPPVEALAYAER